MEIAVLVKPVPEPESRLRPTADGRALDPEGIKWVLAGYDESAVEQALLLRESVPQSRVRAMAFGPAPRAEEVLRSCLALGCDVAQWLEHPADRRPDPVQSARALAVGLGKHPADLILAGKQAGDDEEGLLPGALAELLGLPGFGFVTQLRFDAGRSLFTFDRAVEGGLEQYEVPPPLVVGLQQAWNDPRTAKLPNILKSRKAPIEKLAWADLEKALAHVPGPGAAPAGFRLPAPRTGARMIEYKTPQEAAEKLVRILREEAKVFP